MTRLRRTLALLLIVCLVTGCPRDPGPVDATTGSSSTSTSTTTTGSGAADAPTSTSGAAECECEPAGPAFCRAMTALCCSKGLDFSAQEGPDFCAAYAKWCAEGTSGDTCTTCMFLQATCDEFARMPDHCAGVQEECTALACVG